MTDDLRLSIHALLEERPYPITELAELLELPAADLVQELQALGVARCEGCAKFFLVKKRSAGRYCTRSCYAPGGRNLALAPLPVERVIESRPPRRSQVDDEFDVVWHGGLGPLPGASVAEGLGSTLAGTGFSIGKRK